MLVGKLFELKSREGANGRQCALCQPIVTKLKETKERLGDPQPQVTDKRNWTRGVTAIDTGYVQRVSDPG